MQLRPYKKEEVEFLETQIFSKDIRSLLYRLIIKKVTKDVDDPNIIFAKKMSVLNIFANTLGTRGACFEIDDYGDYDFSYEPWLDARILLYIREASTLDMIQALADILNTRLLSIDEVNFLLDEDGLLIKFSKIDDDFYVERVLSISTNEKTVTEEHPNMQVLVDRAYTCFNKEDGAGVLHATSCIFEALAREVCEIPGKKGKTFSKIFEQYKSKSALPESILNYMLDIYNTRNQEPNAGHGNISGINRIEKKDMVIMLELAKAAIHIEDKLRA